MSFQAVWLEPANSQYGNLRAAALAAEQSRTARADRKSSKAEGLFKQVYKTITQLLENPRHPSLQTHAYHGLEHPYDRNQKVFEAYAQNRTSSAYRIFWCYGPQESQITILAITPHP
jgi:hypothetical protein